MTNVRAIRDQIIVILKAADPKNAAGKSVVRWFTAEPQRSTWPGFPFGWVEALLGPKKPGLGTVCEVQDSFNVVIVDKHIDAVKAENSVLEFAETLDTALEGDPTIGGLVAYSYVSNRQKAKWFEEKSDYSFRATALTLFTRRRE